MTVDCQEVALAAVRQLRKSPYRSVTTVSCDCENGVVVLHGRVRSYYYKQLAQEAVLRIEGVSRVVNEVEVVDSHRCGRSLDSIRVDSIPAVARRGHPTAGTSGSGENESHAQKH